MNCISKPEPGAKCSYLQERWAVLSQLGCLVGQIWMGARWISTGDGPRPYEGDWEFAVEQLRLVCAQQLPLLVSRASEWTGQPVLTQLND